MSNPVLLNDRYVLEKPLGSGGMAVVYRAHDQMLERTVAIKLLREDYSKDEEFKARFHQEAKAAANLVHPNIVTVYDFGIDSGRIYIVMEYVPGTNLNALLQNRGRMAIPETIQLIQQACAGIGYAHRAGLVHCDVKPHNFLITPDNRLKVTDFGIARALESIHTDEHTEIVWGSPQYFSPEQAAGKPPSPASDVYSLGVVLFFMLTGRLPFTATSAEEVARLHRVVPPPSPRQLNPAISPALDEVILKVLSKEPSQRYRTADQLGRVLMALEETSSSMASNQRFSVPAINRVTGQETHSLSTQQPPANQVTRPSTPNMNDGAASLSASPQPRFLNQQTSNQVTLKPTVTPIFGSSETNQPNIPQTIETPTQNPLDIDWITVGLGLAALVAVGGLIPLWVWIYLLYTQQLP